MKKGLLLFAVLSVLFGAGCSSQQSRAEAHAEEICDCLKEVGVNEDLNLLKLQDRDFVRKMERKAERILPKKILKIMKEIESEMADLSKNEKKEYTRSFLKAAIDTECADVALDNIPYDMMGLFIDMLERQIDVSEIKMNQ